MTSRAFHVAILRNAAVLVPAPQRADCSPNGMRSSVTSTATPPRFASALFATRSGSAAIIPAQSAACLAWTRLCDA